MSEANKVDLGSVKVHKRVLAEIVASCMREIKGIQPAARDITGTIQEFMGLKNFPGISIWVDKNNQVTVEVKIFVRYGVNIPEVAKQTQSMIREALEKTAAVELKDVHVNVQGIMKAEG